MGCGIQRGAGTERQVGKPPRYHAGQYVMLERENGDKSAFSLASLYEQAIEPTLAVILVGNDPASQVYVRNKVLRAEEVGIRSLEHRLPSDTTTDRAHRAVDRQPPGYLAQQPCEQLGGQA